MKRRRYDCHEPPPRCPKCRAFPFDQFLPYLVARFDWFGLRKRVFAIICRGCKEIVGYQE